MRLQKTAVLSGLPSIQPLCYTQRSKPAHRLFELRLHTTWIILRQLMVMETEG